MISCQTADVVMVFPLRLADGSAVRPRDRRARGGSRGIPGRRYSYQKSIELLVTQLTPCRARSPGGDRAAWEMLTLRACAPFSPQPVLARSSLSLRSLAYSGPELCRCSAPSRLSGHVVALTVDMHDPKVAALVAVAVANPCMAVVQRRRS